MSVSKIRAFLKQLKAIQSLTKISIMKNNFLLAMWLSVVISTAYAQEDREKITSLTENLN